MHHPAITKPQLPYIIFLYVGTLSVILFSTDKNCEDAFVNNAKSQNILGMLQIYFLKNTSVTCVCQVPSSGFQIMVTSQNILLLTTLMETGKLKAGASLTE